MYRIFGELPKCFTLCDCMSKKWGIIPIRTVLARAKRPSLQTLGAHVLSQQSSCDYNTSVTDCLKVGECSSTSGWAVLQGKEALMFESVCNRLK